MNAKRLALWLVCGLIGVLFVQSNVPSVSAQPAPPSVGYDGWQQIPAGGATTCLRGDPYSFFHRAGDPDKLMIYFQGGGACWNGETCRPGGFADDSVGAFEMLMYDGIFDETLPTNPVADYSIVFVAYCSGDLHASDREAVYTYNGAEHTLQHRGKVNARAALEWAYARYPAPERVLIAGSSAGGYGALLNAGDIINHYTNSQIVVFADASPGIHPDSWNPADYWGMFDQWGIAALLEAYPDIPIGFYSTANDFVSAYAYVLQGGTVAGYRGQIAAMAHDLAARYPNFSAYIADGMNHTILTLTDFYSMRNNGVRFSEWFTALIVGEPVDDVLCCSS